MALPSSRPQRQQQRQQRTRRRLLQLPPAHAPLLLLLAAALLLLLLMVPAAAFVGPAPSSASTPIAAARSRASALGPLHAKKAAAKKGGGGSGKGGGSSGGGGGPSTAKGFGGMGGAGKGSAAGAAEEQFALLRDRGTLALMEWVGKHGGKVDNLGVATVGAGGLRGVVALKPFRKGETLISIPYELALDVTPSAPGGMTSKLGPGDPVLAAEELWRHLDNPDTRSRYAPYLAVLPPPDAVAATDGAGGSQPTPLTTTDFFTEAELGLLGWRPVQEETRARLGRTAAAAERTGKSLAEMKWAVWMVVSRSLGVAGPTAQRQVLIPFLDLCNHAAGSKHVLTGRAAPGGQLKVTAGSDVVVGEEVAFAYGGGRLPSDRFLQDYGFLDDEAASQRWDRLALAAALRAGQCTRADIEALAAASTEEVNGDGSGGERAAMAREYARRMRAAAEVVLKGLDQAG